MLTSWASQFSSVIGDESMGCHEYIFGDQMRGDWFFDGAVLLDLGSVTVEGVLQDKDGDWILGYNKFLGNCSILDAKLWGILEGIKLTQKRGRDKVIIQSDCLEAIKAVHESISNTSNSTLIRRIHHLLSQEDQ